MPFFAGMCYNGRYEKEKELEEMIDLIHRELIVLDDNDINMVHKMLQVDEVNI